MLLCLFIIIAFVSSTELNFDVFKMIEYEKNSQKYGSLKSSFNLIATTSTKETQLSKYVVLIHLEEFNQKFIDEMIEKQVGALLVILPQQESRGTHSDLANFEQSLHTMSISFPVWFALENAVVSSFYKDVQNNIDDDTKRGFFDFIFGDTYFLTVSIPEGTPIKDFSAVNLQGSIFNEGSQSSIALVSNYDTFSIIPSLAYGVESTGSGVTTLLETMRIFSKIFKNYKSNRPLSNYDLHFLLNGAEKNMNYLGTKHWLDNAESKMIESIEAAIFLDTLSGNELFLHVSRSPSKDDKAKKIYQLFQNIASEMNIPFQIIHRKINMSSTQVPWPHQQFAKKKVLAATLSSNQYENQHVDNNFSNINDIHVNITLLTRNIKFVNRVLEKIIFDIPNDSKISVTDKEYGVSLKFVESIINTLSKTPRMMPYFAKDSNYLPVIQYLEKLFQNYLQEVSKTNTPITNEMYSEIAFTSPKAVILSYRNKPALFDLSLSAIILFYLFSIFAYFVGTAEAFNSVKTYLESKLTNSSPVVDQNKKKK